MNTVSRRAQAVPPPPSRRRGAQGKKSPARAYGGEAPSLDPETVRRAFNAQRTRIGALEEDNARLRQELLQQHSQHHARGPNHINGQLPRNTLVPDNSLSSPGSLPSVPEAAAHKDDFDPIAPQHQQRSQQPPQQQLLQQQLQQQQHPPHRPRPPPSSYYTNRIDAMAREHRREMDEVRTAHREEMNRAREELRELKRAQPSAPSNAVAHGRVEAYERHIGALLSHVERLTVEVARLREASHDGGAADRRQQTIIAEQDALIASQRQQIAQLERRAKAAEVEHQGAPSSPPPHDRAMSNKDGPFAPQSPATPRERSAPQTPRRHGAAATTAASRSLNPSSRSAKPATVGAPSPATSPVSGSPRSRSLIKPLRGSKRPPSPLLKPPACRGTLVQPASIFTVNVSKPAAAGSGAGIALAIPASDDGTAIALSKDMTGSSPSKPPPSNRHLTPFANSSGITSGDSDDSMSLSVFSSDDDSISGEISPDDDDDDDDDSGGGGGGDNEGDSKRIQLSIEPGVAYSAPDSFSFRDLADVVMVEERMRKRRLN